MRECPSCRQRVLTSEDVGRLLRTTYLSSHTPPDAQQMTDQIMARIEAHRAGQPEARPLQPTLARRFASRAYVQPSLVALIAVALLGVFAMPGNTMADFPLARMIGFDGVQRDAPDQPDASDSAVIHGPLTENTPLTFEPLILKTLPGGFTLTEQLATGSSRVALTYERADGLEISIVEVPGNDARTAIDRKRYDLDRVDGTDVLLKASRDIGSINSAVWADDSRVFVLVVPLETASVHLDRETALTIIDAIGLRESGASAD